MSTIHEVRVQHFQSLHDIRIELQPFTVIVGPSSSGKSAFTRALRTLVSNRRGTEWITHGERTAAITAVTSDGTVTLTRSRTSSSADNAYVITPADDPTQQQTYSKLGGTTPEDVSRFLGIPSNDPLQFAGQFDKPFLLDDSAAEVARTLGGLTNVSVIFDGARESNRRKLTAAQNLRTRADDLDAIKAKIPGIKVLREQDEALQAAEALILQARDLERSIARLTQAIDIIETTEPIIATLQAAALVPVPDEKPILQASATLLSFQKCLARVPTLAGEQKAAQEAYRAIELEEDTLLDEYSAITGELTDSLYGWITAMAQPRFTETVHGTAFIEIGEAVRVFTLYLETKADQ